MSYVDRIVRTTSDIVECASCSHSYARLFWTHDCTLDQIMVSTVEHSYVLTSYRRSILCKRWTFYVLAPLNREITDTVETLNAFIPWDPCFHQHTEATQDFTLHYLHDFKHVTMHCYNKEEHSMQEYSNTRISLLRSPPIGYLLYRCNAEEWTLQSSTSTRFSVL